MPILQFSICGADWVAQKTQEFIVPYNQRLPAAARFDVAAFPWADYRDELTRMAIYSRGVDVSQIGAPVANDLQAMNALRPFTAAEVEALGGEASFTPAAWSQTNRVVGGKIWTMPWLVDPRGLLYWRDMLEDAGVDGATAFQSFDSTEDALQRLKVAGIDTPLAISLGNSNMAGQASCSWVWRAGGEFVSTDGQRALFTEQNFLTGLHAYFRLAPYLHYENGVLQILEDANDLFINRQAAVLYGGMWPVAHMIADKSHPLRPHLGISQPPGPPISGGSNLAIWNFSRYEAEAVGLAKYLLSPDAQRSYPLLINHLPARVDVIAAPPYSNDPILTNFSQLANSGRSFPNIQLGGLLEGLYNTSVRRIWKRIALQPSGEVDSIIHQEIEALARRFRGWVR